MAAAALALSACGIIHSDSVNKKAVLTCAFQAGDEINAAQWSTDYTGPPLAQARADYNWCFTSAGLRCQLYPGGAIADWTKCLTRTGKPWTVTNGDVDGVCREAANAKTYLCGTDSTTTPTYATTPTTRYYAP